MKDNEKNIAVYLRVSLEDADDKDESDSINNQREIITQFIKKDALLSTQKAEEFVDDGYTGTNFDRPGFVQMMEKIKQGAISCIIVKDLSRFGRNYLEAGDYLEYVYPFLGVRFIAVNDGYDSSSGDSGINIALKNILHGYYSQDLSVKVKSAQKSRMKTGRYVNVPPYGYKRDPADKHHLLIDAETAPVVQYIFRQVLAGYSSRQIASILNEMAIPTRLQSSGAVQRKRADKQILWTQAAVCEIIKNYKYTGAMVTHTRENKIIRAKAQKPVPKEEWIIVEGTHEAIISHEEYTAAQNLLASRRRSKKNGKLKNIFNNEIFYCGYCGHKLNKAFKKNQLEVSHLYCSTPQLMKAADCKNLRWNPNELQEIVQKAFLSQLYILEKQKEKIVRLQPIDEREKILSEITCLENEIETCNGAKYRLYDDYKRGLLTREGFLQLKEQQAQKIEELRQVLDSSRKAYEKLLDEQKKQEDDLSLLERFLTPWNNDDELEKLVNQGIDKVLVFDDSIEIKWKYQNIFSPYLD